MEIFDSIIPIIIFFCFCFFLFRFFKFSGLRGMIYGSRVADTFGEIDLGKKAGTNNILRVHKLENGKIVVEQTSKAIFGASMQGFPMERNKAIELIQSLQKATDA